MLEYRRHKRGREMEEGREGEKNQNEEVRKGER